jgi:hypothetical protein
MKQAPPSFSHIRKRLEVLEGISVFSSSKISKTAVGSPCWHGIGLSQSSFAEMGVSFDEMTTYKYCSVLYMALYKFNTIQKKREFDC